MIEYLKKIELAKFPFSGTAKTIADVINSKENAQACWQYLEGIISDDYEPWTESDINSFIEFDSYVELMEEGLVKWDSALNGILFIF